MNRTFLTPCPYWAEQLAATHPDDLSPSERQALQNHIAICPTCAAVRAEYEAMSKHISQLPAAEPLPGLPPCLLHLWQEQNDNQVELSPLPDDEQAEPIPAPFSLAPRRRRRMSSLVQTLAAVLVVGTLLGSFFVLFTSQHPRSGGPGLHPIIPRGAWHVVSSPNPGSAYNELGGVAAIATNNVWAVGYSADNASVTPGRTLIEHWNGKQWGVIQSPNVKSSENVLSGVAAVSASDIWAVGLSSKTGALNDGQTLIEHWNGKQWSIIQSPNIESHGNMLRAVDTVSASDVWAVGSSISNDGRQEATLIEHWNGKQWSIIQSPSPGVARNELNSVVAISASDVWAVGLTSNGNSPTIGQTLIERWNGSHWSVVGSPGVGSSDNYLTDVAAISASDVWAVGVSSNSINSTLGQTLIEHWNGKQWSIVNSPNVETGGSFLSKSGSMLSTVTAVSANDVWAMGVSSTSSNFDTGRGLILHWDGSQWSIVNSPNSGTGTWLFGTARIPGSSNIWAVGSYGNHSKKEVYDTLTAIYS